MKLFNKKIILFLLLVSFFLFFLHLTTKTIETFLTKKQRKKMSNGLSKAGNAISNAGKSAVGGTVDIAQRAGDGIVDAAQRTGSGIVDTAQQARSGIVELRDDIVDAFKLNILSDAIKGISKSFNQISNSINNLGQPFEESVSLLEKTIYAI